MQKKPLKFSRACWRAAPRDWVGFRAFHSYAAYRRMMDDVDILSDAMNYCINSLNRITEPFVGERVREGTNGELRGEGKKPHMIRATTTPLFITRIHYFEKKMSKASLYYEFDELKAPRNA